MKGWVILCMLMLLAIGCTQSPPEIKPTPTPVAIATPIATSTPFLGNNMTPVNFTSVNTTKINVSVKPSPSIIATVSPKNASNAYLEWLKNQSKKKVNTT